MATRALASVRAKLRPRPGLGAPVQQRYTSVLNLGVPVASALSRWPAMTDGDYTTLRRASRKFAVSFGLEIYALLG